MADAATELAAYLATRPAELAGDDADVPVRARRRAAAQRADRGGAPRFRRAGRRATRDDVRARLGVAWAVAAVDCAEAAPLLDKLLPLADRLPDVLVVAGRCQLRLGHPGAARALAERYLAAAPQAAAGHALRGEAFLAAGDAAEAVRELEIADRTDRSSRSALVLARALREAGKPGAAAERLAALGDGPEPELSVEIAEDLLAAGDASGATARLRPVAARFPGSAPARRVLGETLLAGGAAADALPELETAYRLDPDPARAAYARALVTVGLAAARAGRRPEAETHLARAVEVEPDDRAALVDLGIVRLSRGDPAAALVPLERAARSGHDATALAMYGRALGEAGRASEALLAFRGALSSADDEEQRTAIVLELAATEIDAGAPATAATALQAELSRRPGHPRLEAAFLVAAQAAAADALEHGDAARALQLLESAERIATAPAAIRCLIALAATATGERDVALDRLRLLGGARCPFAAPADELAVPILVAANAEPGQAERGIAKLAAMRRPPPGAAKNLIDQVTRFLALRVAAEAYAGGQVERARRLIADAMRGGASGPELAYDQAVLDLDAGRVDAAIAELEKLQADLPEASIALGLAWEKKGDPARALEAFERAHKEGARFEPLAGWIQAKRRIYRGGP